MPMYNFYCENCLYEKELFLKHVIKNEERPVCECGHEMKQEYFSPHFKHCDKGWYIQDRGFDNEKSEYNFRRKLKGIKNVEMDYKNI